MHSSPASSQASVFLIKPQAFADSLHHGNPPQADAFDS